MYDKVRTAPEQLLRFYVYFNVLYSVADRFSPPTIVSALGFCNRQGRLGQTGSWYPKGTVGRSQ